MQIQIVYNRTKVDPVRQLGDRDRDRFISDAARIIFQWSITCVACQVIAIFGTVTNIINMICFFKQGFKDPVNVTFFGLAVSNLGCILTMIWINLCATPAFSDLYGPFEVDEMIYLGGGSPHFIFVRITSFLTSFITLERCLCIALPLKVARIFTPRRVSIIVGAFFITLTASVSPIYYVDRFTMIFVSSNNWTIQSVVHTENQLDVITVSLAINNIIIPFGAFAVIIICTVILLVSLHRKTKWRQLAAAGNAHNFFSRDQKVLKMILVISTMFIICFVPCVVTCLAMTIEPRIEMYGQYSNTFQVLFGVSFLLETANSSANIFVYYSISSKFRFTFRQVFGFQSDDVSIM